MDCLSQSLKYWQTFDMGFRCWINGESTKLCPLRYCIIAVHQNLLTHLFPMYSFFTPWENCKVFWCFQGAEKGWIKKKCVKVRKGYHVWKFHFKISKTHVTPWSSFIARYSLLVIHRECMHFAIQNRWFCNE